MASGIDRTVAHPVFFAVRNDEGYWVGVWNDEALAQSVVDKGMAAHKDKVVYLVEITKEEYDSQKSRNPE